RAASSRIRKPLQQSRPADGLSLCSEDAARSDSPYPQTKVEVLLQRDQSRRAKFSNELSAHRVRAIAGGWIHPTHLARKHRLYAHDPRLATRLDTSLLDARPKQLSS